MAKAVRSKKQVAKERAALKKLRDLGIIKKFDARKNPTPAQRGLLTKFSDVLSGKAAVVKPKDPSSYSSVYRVVNGNVIVPKRKGEKIAVNKEGDITGTRKVAGRTVKSRFRKTPKDGDVKRQKPGVMYAIPFIRGRDDDGDPIVEWKRFPNYDELKKFMEGYDYKDWADYVVEEEFGKEDDDVLNEKLQSKRRAKARAWSKKARRSIPRQTLKDVEGRKRKAKSKAQKSAKKRSAKGKKKNR